MNVYDIYQNILEYIKNDEYISTQVICQKVNMSEKTLRKYIQNLNEYLKNNGAYIDVKYGQGYKLVVIDQELFGRIYFYGYFRATPELVYSTQERLTQILTCLLDSHDFVSFDKLMNVSFASDATLQKDLRLLKSELKKVNISLDIKLDKGACIRGKESRLRKIALYCVAQNDVYKAGHNQYFDDVYIIYKIVEKEIDKFQYISIPELSMQTILSTLYVTIHRIKSGLYLDNTEIDTNVSKDFPEIEQIVSNVCLQLETEFHIEFNNIERFYILLLFLGNRIERNENEYLDNLVISEHIQEITDSLLEYLYGSLNYDFSQNLSLKVDLWKHFVSMEIRILYDMYVYNPLLDEIKTKYHTAFFIAKQAAVFLQSIYHKDISEHEVGYIAVIFAYHLERNHNKKRILFVCGSGKLSAELLALSYQKQFGDYIDIFKICNQMDLHRIDMNNYDLVLTTIPLYHSVHIPVVEVKNVLDISQIEEIESALITKEQTCVLYEKELFFTVTDLSTKEEVLEMMCKKIMKIKNIDHRFLESVMKREDIHSTDYFGIVAMPHPFEKVCDVSFACVCILDKPVFWGKNDIRIVIMVSVGGDNQNEREIFFDKTSQFLLSVTKPIELLDNPCFEHFIKLLNQ